MRDTGAEPLGWLSECSQPALRAVLRAAAPELADLPIALEGTPDLGNPIWAAARATVGGRVFAKFALSEPTAVRIRREAQALTLLGGELGLAVPKLTAATANPAFSSTELLGGGALWATGRSRRLRPTASRGSRPSSPASSPGCTPLTRLRTPATRSTAFPCCPSRGFTSRRPSCEPASPR